MLLVYEFSFYSEAREKRLWEQVTWQPFLLLASILKLGYLCRFLSAIPSDSISTDRRWRSYNMELPEDAVNTYVLRADSAFSGDRDS